MNNLKSSIRSAAVLFIALIFISFLCLYQCGSPPQEPKKTAAPSIKVDEYGYRDRAKAKRPITLDRWVLIPVKVNNSRRLDLILDTGMPSGNVILTITGDEIKKLGFKDLQTAYIMGAGKGKPTKTSVTENATIEVGGDAFSNQRVILMDRDRDSPFYMADGIIGKKLVFDRNVVEIDLDSESLYLYKPGRFTPPEGWTEVPVEFDKGGRIYFDCEINITGKAFSKARVMVDTGSAFSPLDLVLNPKANILLPAGAVKSVASRGLSGEIKGYWGRTAEVKIGGHRLFNVVTAFSHAKERRIKSHMIGMELLERFNLIFDYHRKRIFIKPNRLYKNPFEFSMTGFLMRRSGNGTRSIYKLLPGSPAQKAGLKPNDVLLEVNGKPVLGMKSRRLQEIFTKEGEVVEIKVQRGSSQLVKRIKLKRII